MISIFRRTTPCVVPAAPRVDPVPSPSHVVWPQAVVVVILVVVAAVLVIAGLAVREVLTLLGGAVMIGAAVGCPDTLATVLRRALI